MKLSHLYTNRNTRFNPIKFRDGLNVVLARVKFPKDDLKVSHNLGKTILIDVIDFCLLKSIDKKHFFKKRTDLFADFVFYLEIKINENDFITVRREASESTKISFKRHTQQYQDFSDLNESEWDHWRTPLERSVQILDSALALTAIKPWSYRKGLSYFLRSQSDYKNEFQLTKFGAGSHKDWKPYLAKIWGLDDKTLLEKYQADADVARLVEQRAELQADVSVKASEYERLVANIYAKADEIAHKANALEKFDFYSDDVAAGEELTGVVERQIAVNNEALYNARFDLTQINESLKDAISFDLKEVVKIFEETKISFPDQLAKDYSELVNFNSLILAERGQHLRNRASQLTIQIEKLELDNRGLSDKRVKLLSTLRESNSLIKFKELQTKLDFDRAELVVMKEKASKLAEIREIDKDLRNAKLEVEKHSEAIKDMLAKGSDRYYEIQKLFTRIVRDTLHRTAVMYATQNGEGNLEFNCEFTDADTDAATEEHRGTSFRQILCIAFDIAVLVAYSKERFFHFVYHDGGFERLESKRKTALLRIIRDACDSAGIQYIISAIDEELRDLNETDGLYPTSEEFIIELHDGGDDGRLFKMGKF